MYTVIYIMKQKKYFFIFTSDSFIMQQAWKFCEPYMVHGSENYVEKRIINTVIFVGKGVDL